ncbi:MAG: 23S rRNA pseudouridine(1911/1915/1917) synthase RluD [Gammaproteobacteria bacterium]|nr:23S rRNA pseudouridine(1911/1915/1917) synthase RluD [Gammaproteobacteria bacterium]
MSEQIKQTIVIPMDHAGLRLDRSLAMLFPEYSRAKIQSWITQELVTVNGKFQVGRFSVTGGEEVELHPVQEDQNTQHLAENIPINIVFEDEHIIVINKPVGLVVHPGAGNHTGTLMNALLHHDKKQSSLPRAGIVHRLDKDTSGVMVVAKSLVAHAALTNMLQERKVERRYYAVVRGQMISGGTIDKPIGRHPHDRTKMAISEKGKPACTHYKIVEKFKRHTWVEAKLETGRTHQIRVHFSAIKYPLIGDAVYAPRMQRVANVPEELNECLCSFPRQALHAFELAFEHPITHKAMKWSTDMPDDMQGLLETLRQHTSL